MDNLLKDFSKWLNEEDRQNFEIERYVEDLIQSKIIEVLEEAKKEMGKAEEDRELDFHNQGFNNGILISRTILSNLINKYK